MLNPLTAAWAGEGGPYGRAGKLFAQLVDVYGEIVDLLQQEDYHANASGLDGPGIAAVEPAPVSLTSFLRTLVDITTDPAGVFRAEPYEEQLIDSGPIRNENGGVVQKVAPAGTRKVRQRRSIDANDVLYSITPDLPGKVRVPMLSGRIPSA